MKLNGGLSPCKVWKISLTVSEEKPTFNFLPQTPQPEQHRITDHYIDWHDPSAIHASKKGSTFLENSTYIEFKTTSYQNQLMYKDYWN